ncbi:MAG: hypothetical protein WEG40_12795 [Candidatus Rokuibacteriota bacterium]
MSRRDTAVKMLRQRMARNKRDWIFLKQWQADILGIPAQAPEGYSLTGGRHVLRRGDYLVALDVYAPSRPAATETEIHAALTEHLAGGGAMRGTHSQ